VALVVLLFVCTPVRSQDVDEGSDQVKIADPFASGIDELKGGVITNSRDVVTLSTFPRYPDARLPISKVLEIIVGFQNNGQKTYNLTSIHGSFRVVGDLSVYIQNFTSWKPGALVKPGDLRTFSYRFYPDPLLEAKEYAFVATLHYTDPDSLNYTTTFYNSSITLTEANLPVDAQTFFASFLGLGVVGLIGFAGYTFVFGKKKRTIETGTRSPGSPSGDSSDSANWIEDSNVASWQKNKEAKKNQ